MGSGYSQQSFLVVSCRDVVKWCLPTSCVRHSVLPLPLCWQNYFFLSAVLKRVLVRPSEDIMCCLLAQSCLKSLMNYSRQSGLILRIIGLILISQTQLASWLQRSVFVHEVEIIHGQKKMAKTLRKKISSLMWTFYRANTNETIQMMPDQDRFFVLPSLPPPTPSALSPLYS